jgi:hypothetical protein
MRTSVSIGKKQVWFDTKGRRFVISRKIGKTGTIGTSGLLTLTSHIAIEDTFAN